MAGVNSSYDPWITDELINRHQLNGPNRRWTNFVLEGLTLSDGGGLVVDAAAGFAYIVGYEVQNGVSEPLALTDNATNYVFFTFTKVLDPAPPLTSVLDILPTFEVNTSGIAPPNSILLGELDTAGGSIVDIRAAETRFDLFPAQFTENLESNHKQIENLVIHKGPVLPAPLESEAGQLFFLTADLELYKFDGVTWVKMAAAATPPAPGAIAVTNGTGIAIPVGTILTMLLGMPTSVKPAFGTSEADAQVIGIADVLIPPFGPGTAGSVQGTLIEAEFESGLILTDGERAFLSETIPGAGTPIQPVGIGSAIAPFGTIFDASLYTGIPPFTKATVLINLASVTIVTP